METTCIVTSDLGVRVDDRDHALLVDILARWDARQGPRVGDFALFPDGHSERFAHDWRDGSGDQYDTIQTSCGGSWYMFPQGVAEFSGSLNPGVHASRIMPTNETRPGTFWTFHHNDRRSHNAFYFGTPCRIFVITP